MVQIPGSCRHINVSQHGMKYVCNTTACLVGLESSDLLYRVVPVHTCEFSDARKISALLDCEWVRIKQLLSQADRQRRQTVRQTDRQDRHAFQSFSRRSYPERFTITALILK